MQNLINYKFILFLILIFSTSIFAQTPQIIEQELVKLHTKISENSGYKSDTDYDVLGKANDDFKTKLLKYTKVAATLKHKFVELDKEITIITSEDGNFRTYSWDRLDGGTMHFFETVYQFQSTDGKVSSLSYETEEGDAGGFVLDIFSVDTNFGKVYLVSSLSIGSTQDRFANVGLYRIDGNKLNDRVKLIKTKSGLTNSIGFGYNFFSMTERKTELITFDKTTKTFKIPVVIEDNEFGNGRVTEKSITYKFNGKNFVKIN